MSDIPPWSLPEIYLSDLDEHIVDGIVATITAINERIVAEKPDIEPLTELLNAEITSFIRLKRDQARGLRREVKRVDSLLLLINDLIDLHPNRVAIKNPVTDMNKWCVENCEGGYRVVYSEKWGLFVFDTPHDAFHFKLRWYGSRSS